MVTATSPPGWRTTNTALEKDGTDRDGQWNFWRNVCVEADRVFFAQQQQP